MKHYYLYVYKMSTIDKIWFIHLLCSDTIETPLRFHHFYNNFSAKFKVKIYSHIDWSVTRRLQREKRELKAPQERSDEEIEAAPAESVRVKRKS